ncbi:MAG: hypothetical protein EA412_06860 [Chitinophagaceae bacterium]|nr:MAG: hypothetical protein EA412_06860 [Chitinophagaceae bacterium]
MFLTLKLLFIFLMSSLILKAHQTDRIDNTKNSQMEISKKSSEDDAVINKEGQNRDMPSLNELDEYREADSEINNRERQSIRREIPQTNSPE